VEKGGWSVFHTWFTGGFILNPVVARRFAASARRRWFGWYENPTIEQLTQEWLDAEGRRCTQEDRRGDPA